MLRATGTYADGWFPAFVFRPRDYAAGLEKVRTAACDAGRDPMAITPAALLSVITGRTNDDVEGRWSQKPRNGMASVQARRFGPATACIIRSAPSSAARTMSSRKPSMSRPRCPT